jgi:hypothetical protein
VVIGSPSLVDHAIIGADFMPTAKRHNVPPWQPFSIHLAIFGHLIETKAAPSEPLGDDVLQIDEGPAADEEDVRRVEGNAALLRTHEAALMVATCLRAA